MRSLNPTWFYTRATARFASRIAVRKVLGRSYRRTPAAVAEEYNAPRERFLSRFEAANWSLDEYVMREIEEDLDENYYFASVLDGGGVRGAGAEVRRRLLSRIEEVVRSYDARSVIEVGSGTGRNLLYLASHIPGLAITGIELTPSSNEVATRAAARYGIPGQFLTKDATTPWDVDKADVIYSLDALEQMPTGSRQALEQMVAHAKKAVVLFEPLPDLWHGLAGTASRLRARYLDRLQEGAVSGFDVTRKTLLPFGLALNRDTEVH